MTRTATLPSDAGDYLCSHAIYTKEEAESLNVSSHFEPQGLRDRLALGALNAVRRSFDFVTGYAPGKMTEKRYLTRIVFLESVAACPGMAAGMVRHLQSLRLMRRDNGWINTLLGEVRAQGGGWRGEAGWAACQPLNPLLRLPPPAPLLRPLPPIPLLRRPPHRSSARRRTSECIWSRSLSSPSLALSSA